MRGKVHILVYCPIDTLQWGSTHSAMVVVIIIILNIFVFVIMTIITCCNTIVPFNAFSNAQCASSPSL